MRSSKMRCASSLEVVVLAVTLLSRESLMILEGFSPDMELMIKRV